jgi:hypothetical protein
MTRGYLSVAAFVMARAQTRLAEKYQGAALATHSQQLEKHALAAIKADIRSCRRFTVAAAALLISTQCGSRS